MSRTFLERRWLQVSIQARGRTISGLLGLLSISMLMTTVVQNRVSAQPASTPSVTPSPQTDTLASLQAKLSGQWQAKNSLGQTITFTFVPDGTLFVQLPSRDTTPVAQKLGYRINPTFQPMQLDVIFPGTNQFVQTIFELTGAGKLRLQIAGTSPGKPRPTTFRPDVSLFEKISDVTTLPPDVQVRDVQASMEQERQTEGKLNIAAMNRGQQAYYLENEKFATTISELGVGIKPENENYRYQIIPQSDSSKSVMMTATAKRPEFRSYTGAVFVVKVENETLTIAEICETDQPSNTPPAMPPAPNTMMKTAIQCPTGSHRLGQ